MREGGKSVEGGMNESLGGGGGVERMMLEEECVK